MCCLSRLLALGRLAMREKKYASSLYLCTDRDKPILPILLPPFLASLPAMQDAVQMQ